MLQCSDTVPLTRGAHIDFFLLSQTMKTHIGKEGKKLINSGAQASSSFYIFIKRDLISYSASFFSFSLFKFCKRIS
jgi:hypothetical protein